MESKNNTLHMTRCDYDAVFYRVFCVTLLAIAFTFTVILTNVFIDIDGLLSSKKDKHNARLNENIIRDDFASETTDNDEMNYGETDDSYRTKRSIETQSFLFHIKNPKFKNILANRLSTLLEELDAEESADMKPKEKKITKDLAKDVEVLDAPKQTEEKKKDKDMLHLTMHNILLQGIIGHMDFHDVYNRVYSLMSNFNELHDKKDGLKPKADKTVKVGEDTKLLPKPIEEKFFEEMTNCNELQEQISQSTTDKENVNKPTKAPPKVVIKTVIDITSIGNDKSKENDTKISKENIKGIIELIYNGKKIKFTRPDSETVQPLPQKKIPIVNNKPELTKPKKVTIETTTAKLTNDYNKIPNSYMNKFIEEYFKRFPHETTIVTNNEIKEHYETKRLKRHVRIKYENDRQKTKKNINKDTGEDELYVEIETHFDNKGLKGERKKKLIRGLIEKIQKAIHSDIEVTDKNSNKTRRRLHFRKRMQDPLEHTDHVLINKYSLPVNNVVHRQLNPISKTVRLEESSPYIGSKSGEDWKKPCFGPGFLDAGKAINSAEMSEVDVDYTKVLDVNGIPQRLQIPLNTELSEETINTNSYYDVGKMKFFIKDIDGSGFSVGFNQYVDEPPDVETMRLFTGLENIIKSYHQNYDTVVQPLSTTEANINAEERVANNYPNNEHNIERRSVNKKEHKHDYHSNEYKIIYDSDFMPFNNYHDIFETNKLRSNIAYSSKKHYNGLPLIVDENILDKNLKPAEILGLANLLERKKRSMNIKKISNLKSKIKLNRYLNTNAMSTKRIFLNKKRSKRQINKIRIIATDLPHLSKNSDENVFVVSDENVFADRAVIKELETSEGDHDKQDETDISPYQSEDIPSTYITKIFDGRSRHNPLMSKYPHVFMEEISRSREEYIPNNALLFGKLPGLGKLSRSLDVEKTDDKVDMEHMTSSTNDSETLKQLKEQEIVNALMAPPPSKANYKVTVKIIPKNQTGLNSGFKEIHTSINKRFNKNGLLYSSLVNVSEISKVIKLNRSKEGGYADYRGAEPFLTKKIKDQQEKMQYLLKQHAKHINEQLSRLNEEKTNLESMLDSDNITEIRYLDYDDMPVTPKHSNYAGIKKEAITREGEASKEVETTTVTIKPRNEIIPHLMTKPPPHPTQSPQSFSDKIKKNIISTIERNGNLTDQILRKIDKNTEILQIFLKKLTEKIQTPTAKPERVMKLENNPFPTEWTQQGMNFNHNMVIRKNDSHISIPFVYAYQQPILPQKSNGQIASVIYHGHIHANALHPKDIPVSAEKEKLKMMPKIQESNNQSRFFIDELENDYKVIQVGDVKKNSDYNMVSGNGTLS